MKKEIEDSLQQYKEAEYQELIQQLRPKPPVVKNALAAFAVGGFICAFAQAINNVIIQTGLPQKEAGTVVVIIMIFLGALLTGLGVYDNIGKFSGAGSIIPITGFANAIVSSAMEWKREGYLFGVAAKMFTIAGPVLVYGILSSVVIGIVYYFLK
ncbi:MAG: stage V sporulation protein AC [Desulfitobacteriaceae bacterium]|nr:stage V sporulation protein AC [Desulfitobacteriaceae bacterium]